VRSAKNSRSSVSKVSKVRLPMKAVYGGTVGRGSSSRGGPLWKPGTMSGNIEERDLMTHWIERHGLAWNQGSLARLAWEGSDRGRQLKCCRVSLAPKGE
jgi:hypothetical protein